MTDLKPERPEPVPAPVPVPMQATIDERGRRFIDRAVVVDRATQESAYRSRASNLRACLSFEPEHEEGILAIADGSRSAPFLWAVISADDTCRSIRAASFESHAAATDDLAAVSFGWDQLRVVDVVDPRSGGRSWWAVLDDVVVLTAGRRWSRGNLRDCHNHGLATLRNLSGLFMGSGLRPASAL